MVPEQREAAARFTAEDGRRRRLVTDTIVIAHRVSSRVRAYVMLTKPRVIELLLVTTVPAMILADDGLPSLTLIGAVLLGGALAAGGANTINCWIERDRDRVMHRTQRRPLPAGQIEPSHALVFGIALEAIAFLWLWGTVNLLAAALAVSAMLFYVFVYTIWLKPRSPQNIVIGGAAGALPPVVGWAAATGSLSVEPLLLFLIIFFWTPPHFWALALFRRDDYARAGVPMLPVVAGPDATRRQILLYTVVLVAVAFAPWPLGYFDAAYGVTSLVLGGAMLALAVNVYRHRLGGDALRATRKLFAFSIFYLFALFATLLIEVVARAIAPSVW
jgi:protoheme IX farnesyltransferase